MSQQPIDVTPVINAIKSSKQSEVESQIDLIAKFTDEQFQNCLDAAMRNVIDGPQAIEKSIETVVKNRRKQYQYSSYFQESYQQEIQALREKKQQVETSSNIILNMIENICASRRSSFGYRDLKQRYTKLFLELVKSGRCDYVIFLLNRVHLQLDLFSSSSELVNNENEPLSALHIAVINKHKEMVRLLLEYGADVTKRDRRGRAPLHYAVDTLYNMRQDKALQKDYNNSELYFQDYIFDGFGTREVQNNIDIDIIKLLLEYGATCLEPLKSQVSTQGNKGQQISVFEILAKQLDSQHQPSDHLIQAFNLLSDKFPLTESIKLRIENVNDRNNWLHTYIRSCRVHVLGTPGYDSLIDRQATTVNKLSDEIQGLKRSLHTRNASSREQIKTMAQVIQQQEEAKDKLERHVETLEQRIQRQESESNDKILELTRKLDEVCERLPSDANDKETGGENKRRRAASPARNAVSIPTEAGSSPPRFKMF